LGLGSAAVFTTGALFAEDRTWALVFLSLTYGGITLQQPGVLGVCLDIGGDCAGAVTGAMNTATFLSSFLSSIAYGYLVKIFGNYNAPFWPMIVLLFVSALLWLTIDPTRKVNATA
jgi:ACS family glucarate transporter-like MFS transporter